MYWYFTLLPPTQYPTLMVSNVGADTNDRFSSVKWF